MQYRFSKREEVIVVALPELTPEQRQAALEKAAIARQIRAEVKNRMKHSGVTVREVLLEAKDNEAIARIKVIDLISAVPGIGKVTALEIMERLEIAPSRRIRGLGEKQAKALVEEFARRV